MTTPTEDMFQEGWETKEPETMVEEMLRSTLVQSLTSKHIQNGAQPREAQALALAGALAFSMEIGGLDQDVQSESVNRLLGSMDEANKLTSESDDPDNYFVNTLDTILRGTMQTIKDEMEMDAM